MTDNGGVSLASKASLAIDFPVGSLAGSGCAGCGGTANGHAGTKPSADAGDSVPVDWTGSGSSAELGRARADVDMVAADFCATQENCLFRMFFLFRETGGGGEGRARKSTRAHPNSRNIYSAGRVTLLRTSSRRTLKAERVSEQNPKRPFHNNTPLSSLGPRFSCVFLQLCAAPAERAVLGGAVSGTRMLSRLAH